MRGSSSGDFLSTPARSALMSRIRSRGNKSTELIVATLLRSHRITGWRRHMLIAGIRPDFVWKRIQLAIFVDGCFWHGCPRCWATTTRRQRKLRDSIDSTRQRYWVNNIHVNIQRDRRQTQLLRRHGWQVIRLRESTLRPSKINSTANKLTSLFELRQSSQTNTHRILRTHRS